MKATTNKLLTALALAALTAGAWAQTEVASNTAPAKDPAPAAATPAPAPVTAADVQALKDALAAQQLQIQKLTEQLQRQQDAQQSPANAAAKADTTPTQANPPQQIAALGTPAPAQQEAAPAPAAAATQESEQVYNKQMEGPLTLHFRGINITPGGYAEGAFVRRSKGLAADLPTPFNSVAMPGAS